MSAIAQLLQGKKLMVEDQDPADQAVDVKFSSIGDGRESICLTEQD